MFLFFIYIFQKRRRDTKTQCHTKFTKSVGDRHSIMYVESGTKNPTIVGDGVDRISYGRLFYIQKDSRTTVGYARSFWPNILTNHNRIHRKSRSRYVAFQNSALNISPWKYFTVICHAWLETLLDVIELLPVEIIRTQVSLEDLKLKYSPNLNLINFKILPTTINKGQLSQTIYSRIDCSRLLGKICTRFGSSL